MKHAGVIGLLKCWPMILGTISGEARTEVWVPLSHTASGKEGIEEVYFLPYLSFSFDSCNGPPLHGPTQVRGTKPTAWTGETVTGATGLC